MLPIWEQRISTYRKCCPYGSKGYPHTGNAAHMEAKDIHIQEIY
jgi:hypothetical protein